MKTEDQKRAAREAMQRWRMRNPDKVRAANKKHWEENKEYHLSRNKKWVSANGEHLRRYRRDHYYKTRDQQLIWKRIGALRKKYGLELSDVLAMWNKQNGRCRICECNIQQDGPRTHIDHCHNTGRIRGLLCSGCNRMLGRVERLLPRILEYLA
jgi:hypothetical protein